MAKKSLATRTTPRGDRKTLPTASAPSQKRTPAATHPA